MNIPNKLTACIVEDELHNIELLKSFINRYCPSVEIIGVARSLEQAKQLLHKKRPDMVFLDIILENELVFDLFNDIDHDRFQIIFTTAYREHALQAFKLNAVDYLLKPFSIEQLEKAVARAEENIRKNMYLTTSDISKIKEFLDHRVENERTISVVSNKQIDIIVEDKIAFLSSERRYTIIHMLDGTEYVASQNLSHYESVLNQTDFMRIHRCHIINLNHLLKVYKEDGTYCVLKNGKSLPVARRRLSFLKMRFNF